MTDTRDWANERAEWAMSQVMEWRAQDFSGKCKIFAAALREARQAERDAIVARLREPDEAMVKAFVAEMHDRRGHYYIRRASAAEIIAGLADVLFPPPRARRASDVAEDQRPAHFYGVRLRLSVRHGGGAVPVSGIPMLNEDAQLGRK